MIFPIKYPTKRCKINVNLIEKLSLRMLLIMEEGTFLLYLHLIAKAIVINH